MLSARHKLPAGHLSVTSTDFTYVYNRENAEIRVYEQASGLLEQVYYAGVQDDDIINITVGGSKLLLFSSLGNAHFFDLDKNCSAIATVAVKNAFHTLEPIICASRDGVFFLTAPNSTSLRCIAVTSENAFMTPVLRLDNISERGKPILRMSCHPSRPYVNVQCTKGSVQIWSYSKLAKQLVPDMEVHEEGEEEVEENRKHSSSASELFLSPLALLLSPSPHKQTPVNCSCSTHFAAVIWTSAVSSSGSAAGGDVIAVYDLRAVKLRPAGDAMRVSHCSAQFVNNTAYRLMHSCFHSHEPMLHLHYVYSYKHYVSSLSLLDASLPPVMTSCVTENVIAMECDGRTSHLLVTSSTSSGTAVTAYELTVFFRSQFSVCQPVVSALSVPSSVFYADADSAFSPLLLTVHTEVTYGRSSSGGAKSAVSIIASPAARLFRMPLNLTSQDKNVPIYIGDLPVTINMSTTVLIPHVSTPPAGTVFLPTSIAGINHISHEGTAYDMLIRGTVLITSKLDASADWSSEMISQPALCFASYRENNLTTQVIDAADGVFWGSGTGTNQFSQVLILDSSQQQLRLCSAAVEPIVYNLPFRLHSLHTAPTSSNTKKLIAVTLPERDGGSSIVISSPGAIDFDLQSYRYDLLPHENVLQVLCQPLSSNALVGILTEKRVIILSQELVQLAQVNTASRALSLTWICSALCYADENGTVRYLLPRNVVYDSSHSHREVVHKMLARAMAIDLDVDLQQGQLCSLSRQATETRCFFFVGCLPDRLIYATYACLSPISGWKLNYCVRPTVPAEPVLLSVLIAEQSLEKRKSLLLQLVSQYFGAKPLVGSDAAAIPSSQSTGRLCLALTLNNHEDIALVVAGITTNSLESTGADFVRHRWITPASKFLLCLRAGKAAEACSELMASRPELQELFLDPESFGGGTLPHRESAVAQYYSFAARVLASMGYMDYARRLSDIAGDDEFLALLLQIQNRHRDLQGLAEALASRSGNFQRVLLCLLNETSVINDKKSKYVPMNGVGNSDRRTTLLPISALTDTAAPYKGSTVDLSQVERLQRSHVSSRGGGIGPLTKLGVLAMDLIDDYGVKSYPEALQFSDSAVKRGDNYGDSSAEVPAGLTTLPPTWVEDVGVGKEWDRISAYLRFSDLFRPGDEEFVSSISSPPAQLNVLDLSKYANGFELYYDSQQRVSFEQSTSPVDPGDAHDKVKSVYDLIFHDSSSNAEPGQVGLRCVCGRGSALDIGMFHEDSHRNKLTIEMFVYRLETSAQSPTAGNASVHHLIRRCIGKPKDTIPHHKHACVWSLDVNSMGSLIFSCGKQRVATEEGAVNMGPTADVPVSLWTHVAVIIDSHENSSAISMFINGANIVKGAVDLPSFSEDDLTFTTWYLFPDLSGWRVTEVRLWSDARSSVDIENCKDNYLPLASKRKRLQFRIKGSKKLFGPLPNFAVTYDPMSGAQAGSGGNANNSCTTASRKELSSSLPAPLAGGRTKKALAAPPASGGGLLKPPSSTSGVLQPPKRSSLPTDALASITSAATASTPPSTDYSFLSDSKTAAPGSPSAESFRTGTSSTEGVAASGGLLRPPATKRPQRRSSLATHTLPSSLSQLSTSALTDRISSSATPDTISFGSIASIEITVSDVAKCIRRRLLSSSQQIMGFVTSARVPPVENEVVLCKADKTALKLIRKSLCISCESVIMSPSASLLAYYSNKNILVIDVNTENKVVEQIMSIPLVFWCFESETKIIFVTHQFVYSWSAVAAGAPPSKLFARIDIADAARFDFTLIFVYDAFRWAERKVIDVQVCSSGWIMIVSCLRLSGAAPANYDEALTSAIVSFYHMSSQEKHFQVIGCCGCFLSAGQCAVYVGSASGLEDNVFVLNIDEVPSSSDIISLSPSLSFVARHRNVSITQKRSAPPHPILLQGNCVSGVGRALVVLHNIGQLLIISEDDVVQSHSISDEPILSSAVISEGRILQVVTGTTGKFLTVELSSLC